MYERRPLISAVIPSLRGETARLEQALRQQTCALDEIEVVRGVRPNGRARNLGVAATHGELLLFVDDDAMPVSHTLVEALVKIFDRYPGVGVAGTARVLPAGVPWFQRRTAYEVPRTVNPIPAQALETNPPLDGYGHSLITTTCCMVPRRVFEQAGGFCEDLTSGVDTDFFYRVRRLGYRFMMAPGVAVSHPAPENLRALWQKFYWYGRGYGQETLRRPEQRLGFRLASPLRRALFLLAATFWLLPNVFILYSFGYPRLEIGFRPLKAFSTYAVAWGYTRSWQEASR